MKSDTYVLGHDPREVRRLQLQGKVFAAGTERMLIAAGLQAEHSVLDIGTGAGDVALIAARLTGPAGAVLGIDRESSVLDLARERAEREGHGHLRFRPAALDALGGEDRFDFVVGRYVLVHQQDPAHFIERACAFVRPGGTLLLVEPDVVEISGIGDALGEVWSNPPDALYDDTIRQIVVAFGLAGVRVSCGGQFIKLFKEAGLPTPTLQQEIPVAGPDSEFVEWAVLTLRSLLPLLERHGVTTGSRIQIETLQDRMQASVSARSSQLRFANLVGAWAKLG